jgi:hypothetical protein
LRLRDDWLAPQASLDWLLGMLGPGERSMDVITPQELGGPADHFGWMRMPAPIAARIAGWLADQEARATMHAGTIA